MTEYGGNVKTVVGAPSNWFTGLPDAQIVYPLQGCTADAANHGAAIAADQWVRHRLLAGGAVEFGRRFRHKFAISV